jgi:hypothetical protein
MKLVKIIALLLMLASQTASASHWVGGELTWECLPSGSPDAGKFIFN